MPMYEYHCSECNKNFTVKLSVAEHDKKPAPKCQYCKGKNTKQVFAGVSVITSKKS